MFKKIFFTLICAFLLIGLMAQTAFGKNNVSDIHVEVAIYDDGSAYITQTWNCEFTEGTEGYIPIQNLGEMSISDFLVSDINGPYSYVENWDTEASFEEKTGKYGMVETEVGYELCWGISEYGERRYAIEYKIDNFVGAYEDLDGFNFQFINSGMGTLPTDVTVTIIMQNETKLDANNAGVWAFGFDGQIEFEDGQVVAFTNSPLSSSSDSVIIMMHMNKGLINPTRVVDQSFETVKAEAFKSSDYEDASEPQRLRLGFYLLFIGITIAIIHWVLKFCFWLLKGMPKRKVINLYKKADYFRGVPIAGNLEANLCLAEKVALIKDDGDLIGAAFLKLIHTGCLEPITEKNVGLFGIEKEKILLKLVHPPEFIGIATNMLYDLLVLASGNDQILQEDELENYCSRKHEAITQIIEASKEDGEKTLMQIDCYDQSKKSFFGLSERGKSLLLNIMGFKKYLLEFSLISERSVAESIIWQDYLTVATLLGIADQVIEQFEKVYPGMTSYSENAHYYYLARRYRKVSYDAAQGALSGGGGLSSLVGGGGFSGGGFGGGTR